MFSFLKKSLPFSIKQQILYTFLKFQKKVDFAIVGFPKCATTSISANLQRFHNVALPSYEVQLSDFALGKIAVPERDKLFGIKNPNLLYELHNLSALIKRNTEIKLIVCLRKPSDWLFSFFQYRKLELKQNKAWVQSFVNKQPDLINTTFQDIIYREKELIGVNIERGIFINYLEPLLKYSRPAYITIVFLEDIAKNPKKIYDNIFQHLGLSVSDSFFKPIKANQKHNHYESKHIYHNELLDLEKLYKPHNERLNALLLKHWGINNIYW